MLRQRGARALCAASRAGRFQTPIVDTLWRKRAAAKARAEFEASQTETLYDGERRLIEKSPLDSANAVTYALSTDEALADTYRNPWGHVRAGRLLEDLDALAGTVAFDHCQAAGERDLHIVTASVDRIVYRDRPSLDADLTLSGRVTWVGRSSMEIAMQATSSTAAAPFVEATFSFVARDAATGKAARINPLRVADGSADAAAFALGQQRDDNRKAQRKLAKSNLYGHALDDDAQGAAHELLEEAKRLISMPALADSAEILLSQTTLQNALTCQPQQRNTAGRIFGGFLMRRAFELAFSTAHLFAGRRPVFLELDLVSFKSPVSVGDLLKFDSCVLYTSEAMDILGRLTIHVEVLASVLKPEARTAVRSNAFNFTFGIAANPDGSGRAARLGDPELPELRRVLPATHEEAYRIMTRYKADLQQRAEDEAALREPRAEGD